MYSVIKSGDDMGGASRLPKGQCRVVAHELASSNKCAPVQTRAMKERESKPPKPLKVSTIDGLEIGPEQLIQQQKSDDTLKQYWELADKPAKKGNPSLSPGFCTGSTSPKLTLSINYS